MQRIRRILVVVMAAAAAACNTSKSGQEGGSAVDSLAAALPPGHVPITPSTSGGGLSETSQALLDSGNTAFRVEDFAGALAYYAKSAAASPGHAAPWFGTYMVAQATDDKALADSALRMVRERAPDMQAHPSATPGAAPMPAPGAPHGSIPPAPHGAIPPAPRKS